MPAGRPGLRCPSVGNAARPLRPVGLRAARSLASWRDPPAPWVSGGADHGDDGVRGRDSSGDQERQGGLPQARESDAQRRSGHEPDPEGGAPEEPEQSRTLRSARPCRPRLPGLPRASPARPTVDDAAPRKSSQSAPDARPVSQDWRPCSCPPGCQDEDGLAADPVGEAPQHRTRTRSWAAENEATSNSPIVVETPPQTVGRRARNNGTTVMPKPTRSTATVVQMIPKPGGSDADGARPQRAGLDIGGPAHDRLEAWNRYLTEPTANAVTTMGGEPTGGPNTGRWPVRTRCC